MTRYSTSLASHAAMILFAAAISGATTVPDPASKEPVVEGGDDVSFRDIDVAGVLDVVGEGVLVGVPAPVVSGLMCLVALHLASAQSAEHESAKDVVAARPSLLGTGAASAAGRHDRLNKLKVVDGDKRWMGDRVGPHPGQTRKSTQSPHHSRPGQAAGPAC